MLIPATLKKHNYNLIFEIALLQSQKEFANKVNKGKKYTLFSGGIGNGKTYICDFLCLKMCIQYPGIRGVIARRTVTSLKRTTQKVFLDMLTKFGLWDFVEKFNKSDNLLTFKNGSEIYFIDLEDITKVMGMELGFAYVDEAREIKESVFLALIGRLRQKDMPLQCLLSTNPDTPAHWLYKLFYENPDDEFQVVDAKTNENTYLPESYLSTLDKVYHGIYKERFLSGKWVAFEGLVYNEFNPSVHVVDGFDFGDRQAYDFYRAIDWGYTNPFVCLWIAVDRDNNFYVFDEIYIKNYLLPDLVRLVKERHVIPYITTYADPSEPQNINYFASQGLPVEPAYNRVMPGIQLVKEHFAINTETDEPKIYIGRNCKNLIRELQLYRWHESKEGKHEKEEPVKLDDHACDALRYFIASFKRGKTDFHDTDIIQLQGLRSYE